MPLQPASHTWKDLRNQAERALKKEPTLASFFNRRS